LGESKCTKYPKYLLPGETYNDLIVISVVEASKYEVNKEVPPSSWEYSCQCKCGNIIVRDKNSICKGKVKRCKECTNKANSEAHKKYNTYLEDEDFCYFHPSNASDKVVMVDKEDLHKIKNNCWYSTERNYVRTVKDNVNISLHRVILNYWGEEVIDHIDGNPLNNKKENLRVCTVPENGRNHKVQSNNTSGSTGVSWNKRSNKWQAYIVTFKTQKHIGYFTSYEDAVKARKEAELQLHGEYSAHVNRKEY
jgi:hypothetical protein